MFFQTFDRGQDLRYRALLELVDLPGSVKGLPDLLTEFALRLAPAVPFDECLVVTLDPDEPVPRALALPVRREPGGIEPGETESIPLPDFDAPPFAALPAVVILRDLQSERRLSALTALLRQRGQQSACLLPLGPDRASARVACLAAAAADAFAGTDLELLQRAAALFGQATAGHETRLRLAHRERAIEAERNHWRTLLELNNLLVGTLDMERLRAAIAVGLRRILQCDSINLFLFDVELKRVELFSLDPDVPQGASEAVASIRVEDTPFADPQNLRGAWVAQPGEMRFLPTAILEETHFRSMKRFCLVPLCTPRRTLGAIALSSRREDAFALDAVSHALEAAGQVAIAIENSLAFQEIGLLKERLAQENLYLADEVRGWNEFRDIVGESKALQHVRSQVRTVADTDTTVLLLGETGTGKELFARAIHNLSARKARTLVAVNCAASPASLLESEWFGYEKGAFTGALTRKTGRFEVADKGTLFLDEIGDIPLDLQAKLLRVLQEHEVERVGATRPAPVDFRLIAATNADLPSMVNDKKFRSDLYYRLSVFPIRVPPLRERREDIPPLVMYFTQTYAKRLRRQVDSVPRDTMDALCRWPWPGNVRELQNVLERAVILSRGRSLEIPAAEFATPAPVAGTLEAAEREHILRALLDTNWVVGGPNGAATRLGLKRTTLVSTMKRLGIVRPGTR